MTIEWRHVEPLLTQPDNDKRVQGLGALEAILSTTRVEHAQHVADVLRSLVRSNNSHVSNATLKSIDLFGKRHPRDAVATLLAPVVDKLGDQRLSTRESARNSIVSLARSILDGNDHDHDDLWNSFELGFKDPAFLAKNPRTREQALLIVRDVRLVDDDDNSAVPPLKPFTPHFVALLTDPDSQVRSTALSTTIKVFSSRRVSQAARTDLKQEMNKHGLPKRLEDQILNNVLGGGGGVEREGPPATRTRTRALAAAASSSNSPLEADLPSDVVPSTTTAVVVEPVYVASVVDLRREFDRIRDAKQFEGKETEHNWIERDKSIARLRGMVQGGVCNDDDDRQLANEFVAQIKEIQDGIMKTSSSLRTTLAISTLTLLSSLCDSLPRRLVDQLVEPFFDHALSFSSQTKKMVATASQLTVERFLENSSFHSRYVASLTTVATTDKVVNSRQFASRHLTLLIKTFPTHLTSSSSSSSGGGGEVERAIKHLLRDANAKVRENAREAYWEYYQACQQHDDVDREDERRNRAELTIREGLDTQAQKLLDKVKPRRVDHHHDEAIPPPPPSSRKTPTSTTTRQGGGGSTSSAPTNSVQLRQHRREPPSSPRRGPSQVVTSPLLATSSRSVSASEAKDDYEEEEKKKEKKPSMRELMLAARKKKRLAEEEEAAAAASAAAREAAETQRDQREEEEEGPVVVRGRVDDDATVVTTTTTIPDQSSRLPLPLVIDHHRERTPRRRRRQSTSKRNPSRFAGNDPDGDGEGDDTVPDDDDASSSSSSDAESEMTPSRRPRPGAAASSLSLQEQPTRRQQQERFVGISVSPIRSPCSSGGGGGAVEIDSSRELPPLIVDQQEEEEQEFFDESLRDQAIRAEQTAERFFEIAHEHDDDDDDDDGINVVPIQAERGEGGSARVTPPRKGGGGERSVDDDDELKDDAKTTTMRGTMFEPQTPIEKKSNDPLLFRTTTTTKQDVFRDSPDPRDPAAGGGGGGFTWWNKRAQSFVRRPPPFGSTMTTEADDTDYSVVHDDDDEAIDSVVDKLGRFEFVRIDDLRLLSVVSRERRVPSSSSSRVEDVDGDEDARRWWTNQRRFETVFEGLKRVSLDPNTEPSLREVALVVVRDVVENQFECLASAGHEADVFQLLFRSREDLSRTTTAATESIATSFTSRIEPLYGLGTLVVALEQYLSSSSSKEEDQEEEPTKKNVGTTSSRSLTLGLKMMASFFERLPAEVLEDVFPTTKKLIKRALDDQTSGDVRRSAIVALVSAQSVLLDVDRLTDMLGGLEPDQANLLSYYCAKRGV